MAKFFNFHSLWRATGSWEFQARRGGALSAGVVLNRVGAGPLIMDAHLAALAIEHGATLATSDRDFARFPRLKFFNPLDPL